MRLLLSLLILIFSAGYYLIETESGLQISICYLAPLVPGKLSIQHATGKMGSTFELHDISYQNADTNIYIKSLQVTWNPAELLRNKIVIDTISLGQTSIKINDSPVKSTSFSFAWLRYLVLKQLVIQQLTLQKSDARFTCQGSLSDQWHLSYSANLPHLQHIVPTCFGSLNATGVISGSLKIPNIAMTAQGKQFKHNQLSIQTWDSKLQIHWQPGQESTLFIDASGIKNGKDKLPSFSALLHGHMRHHKQALLIDATTTIAKNYHLVAQLSLPEYKSIFDINQPIIGKITTTSSHLDLLHTFIPDLSQPTGNARLTVNLRGMLHHPLLSGELTLTQGRVDIPRLGITLKNIYLQAKTDKSQQITYEGGLQSGKGKAEFQGIWDVTKTRVMLQGNDLQLVNLPEYKITASPHLQLHFADHHLQIQGNVMIPTADILPKNRNNIENLPSEVIFSHQPKPAALPFDIAMQINLQLGNRIHIVYDDLQTYLTGHLQLIHTPHSVTTAQGELLTTQGIYTIYGQVLTIQEGRLLFTGGALLNPGLHIRATKKVKTVLVGGESSFTNTTQTAMKPVYAGTDELTVGVNIEGSANKPQVTLFSTPAGMSQNDILSYLIFGYPQSQVSDKQNKLLFSAATALHMGGKTKLDALSNTLQKTFGLSELNVESTPVFDPTTGSVNSAPSFVIGKQIAPNLYAHYSIGLFHPTSILNLRFQLSKYFAIQSETSTIDNGADLLYSIERD